MSCSSPLLPWIDLQFVIVVFPDHTHLLLDFNYFYTNTFAMVFMENVSIRSFIEQHDDYKKK